MKKTKIKANIQRVFIQGLITSDQFLAGAASHLDTSLFESSYLKTVADWCIEYHETHRAAPGKSIEAIYHSWRETQEEDSPDSKAISSLLGGLSREYESADEINEIGRASCRERV